MFAYLQESYFTMESDFDFFDRMILSKKTEKRNQDGWSFGWRGNCSTRVWNCRKG